MALAQLQYQDLSGTYPAWAYPNLRTAEDYLYPNSFASYDDIAGWIVFLNGASPTPGPSIAPVSVPTDVADLNLRRSPHRMVWQVIIVSAIPVETSNGPYHPGAAVVNIFDAETGRLIGFHIFGKRY